MRTCIRTEDAPAAIGPYSQAVKLGPWVFCAGQIPLRPSGSLVGVGIEAQARQVLDNLRAVLAAAGCGLSDVVKTTIYLVDLEDFEVVNRIYGQHFASDPPARSTVQVAGLPKGARLEIEAIAYREPTAPLEEIDRVGG